MLKSSISAKNIAIVSALSLGALTATVSAQGNVRDFQVAETGKDYASLSAAVKAIGGGTGTILISDGRYADCAVQTAGNISYKAKTPGRVIFDKAICEGKAALVLRGNSASVDGIIFQNMAVPDGNGAGIRLEKGNLNVTRSVFRNSEQGILTANDANGSITIDRSTFSGLGRCDRGLSCAHSIYIGDYGALTVTNSRFEQGTGGHYVKSRSARVNISNNAFDDVRGRTTNYMIDLPAGSVGKIMRNSFVQGRNKENYSAFIAIAAEGRVNSSAGLQVANNDARIAPGIDRSSVFLANWSRDTISQQSNRLGDKLKPYEER